MKPSYTAILILFLFGVAGVFAVLGLRERSNIEAPTTAQAVDSQVPATFCSQSHTGVCILQYAFRATLQGRKLTVGSEEFDLAPADNPQYGLLGEDTRVYASLQVSSEGVNFVSPQLYSEFVSNTSESARCVSGVLEFYRKAPGQFEAGSRLYSTGSSIIRLQECNTDTVNDLENETIIDLLNYGL